jgi:hypothetical protein
MVRLAGELLLALRVKILATSYCGTTSLLFLQHARGIYLFLTCLSVCDTDCKQYQQRCEWGDSRHHCSLKANVQGSKIKIQRVTNNLLH